MKTLEECLGWHLDWPDGSSTYKVWFDWNGKQMETVTLDYLLDWVRDNGVVLNISWSLLGSDPTWHVLYKDQDGRAHLAQSTNLRRALVDAIRDSQGEL